MIDDQSDAFKKAMRDVTDAVDAKLAAKLAERQIAAARRIAAFVHRSNSKITYDKQFLKGLCIEPW